MYYPRAVAQGKPVEAETIAEDLAKIATVSNGDVQVLFDETVGVKFLADFDFQKQDKVVRIEFIPDRKKLAMARRTPVPSWIATSWSG